jgi:hypothetical protein
MASMNEKQELIRELEKRKLWSMVLKARDGHYSVMGSPYVHPIRELIRELEAAGHPDLVERARNGDFEHER